MALRPTATDGGDSFMASGATRQGVQGRPDAIRPPTGGPGTPAPSYPMMRTGNDPRMAPGNVGRGARPVIRPPQEIPGDARRPVVAPARPTPTQPMPHGGMPPTATGGGQVGIPNIAQAVQGGQMQMHHMQPQATGFPPPQQGAQQLQPPTPSTGTPLNQIGNVLQNQLANPSRFGLPQVQEAFNFLQGELQRGGDEAAAQARSDAASRGVFFGTPSLQLEQKARQPFQSALGGLGTNLMLDQARTQGQDMNQAIQNVFGFGDRQQQADQFAAQLGLNALGQGLQGMPNINSAINAFGQLPLLQGGGTGAMGGALGQLTGLMGQPGQPQVTAPAQAPQQPPQITPQSFIMPPGFMGR